MCWEVIAAIAASITAVLTLLLFVVIPAVRRFKRNAPLSRIGDLKDRAIELQNANKNRNLTNDELNNFKAEVEQLKEELLNEIGKISKPLARQYENFGAVDVSMFLSLTNKEQVIYLGVVKRCWELADKIAERYS